MNGQIVAHPTTTFMPPPLATKKARRVHYPTSDGKPMGETEYHIILILSLIMQLRAWLTARPDAYVVGDILFYYEEGNNKRFIVPDVMVVFGTHQGGRTSYKLWEEDRAPAVVIEVASKSTYRRDLEEKKDLYQSFGVAEYYVTDPMPPDKRCLAEPLMAYWLDEAGEYARQPVNGGRIYSPALGLELVHDGVTLRLFDPVQQVFIPTYAEAVTAQQEAEAAQREAEARAARQAAEAEARAARQALEIEQLRAELARLKGNS